VTLILRTYLVRRRFAYLVDQHGFSIREQLLGPKPFDDAVIEFSSDHTLVSTRLDRGDVLVNVGPPMEPEVARVSLVMAVAYFTGGRITSIAAPASLPGDYEQRINHRVAAHSEALRQFCQPLLTGEFRDWLALSRFALKNIQDDYQRMTGKRLPDNINLATYVRAKSKRWGKRR
jgi:hypothetical protein